MLAAPPVQTSAVRGLGCRLIARKVLLLMPFLMSPADALFLLAERPERPLHVGTLALLNPPEGTDGWDLREMVAAAQARERVAPLWRRRPHRSLSSLGQWYWRSDAEVDLGYHVRVSALPAPGGLAELWDLVSRLHGGLLDRTRPLWQLHLIEGLADGRYAAYIKTHPALLAGVSAMRLMQQIVGTDPDRRGMHALWEVTEQTPPCDAAAPVSWGDPLDAVRGALGTAKELAGMGPLTRPGACRARPEGWRAWCPRSPTPPGGRRAAAAVR